MIDKHLTDLAVGVHGNERVSDRVRRIGVQACGQRPALRPGPGGVVDLKGCREDRPGVRRQEIPRDHHVAGGVAGTKAGEVDDGAQMSAADQQVAEVKIAVEPDLGAVSGWRPERRVPYRGHRSCVKGVLHCRCCSARCMVAPGQRYAGDLVAGIRGVRFHRQRMLERCQEFRELDSGGCGEGQRSGRPCRREPP